MQCYIGQSSVDALLTDLLTQGKPTCSLNHS